MLSLIYSRETLQNRLLESFMLASGFFLFTFLVFDVNERELYLIMAYFSIYKMYSINRRCRQL